MGFVESFRPPDPYLFNILIFQLLDELTFLNYLFKKFASDIKCFPEYSKTSDGFKLN